MGQCLGRPYGTMAEKRDIRLRKKLEEKKKATANGEAAPIVPEASEENALTFTKGSSMALPEDSKLPSSKVREVDPQAAEIEAFLLDNTNFEDDLDHPVYMKIDKTYKVGTPVVYPPELKTNIAFTLHEPNDEAGVQVSFAYKSLQGRTDSRGTGADKPNQDSVAVVRNKETPQRAIFGVFDGHGPYGEHASHFCRMELLKMYTIAMKQHPTDDSKALLGHTLRYLDRKFASTDHKAAKVDPIVSGTTAVVIMLDGNQIIAANVGDSRAILGTRKGNVVSAEPLTDDHKPERPDEKARIEASNAILMNEYQVRGRQAMSGQSPGKTYICRHTNGEIVYGVLFTRSIGDVDAHKNLGVSSEPEFQMAKISEEVDEGEEQVIIIASDGVWDMMGNQEASEIAFKTFDPLSACDEIVSKCAERWAKSGEGRRDDITVCVVGLGVKFGNNDTSRSDRMGSYYGLI